MKQIIILLGIPGSGKGTQAKKIRDKYDYEHISTGDLLRNLDKDLLSQEDYEEIKNYMNEGKVVPDKYIYKLAFPEIEQALEEGNGVVLDGAIRTKEQAKQYQQFFEGQGLREEVLALEIELSEEEAIKRLIKRAKDSDRADDNEETIKERIKKQGQKALEPVVNFYDKRGLLERVDGSKNISEVEEEIDSILQP